MSLELIQTEMNKLGNDWEAFKSENDSRLKEIEAKGSADPLREETLNRINGFMDEAKSKMDAKPPAVRKLTPRSSASATSRRTSCTPSRRRPRS